VTAAQSVSLFSQVQAPADLRVPRATFFLIIGLPNAGFFSMLAPSIRLRFLLSGDIEGLCLSRPV
jgi:hypothetical protein